MQLERLQGHQSASFAGKTGRVLFALLFAAFLLMPSAVRAETFQSSLNTLYDALVVTSPNHQAAKDMIDQDINGGPAGHIMDVEEFMLRLIDAAVAADHAAPDYVVGENSTTAPALALQVFAALGGDNGGLPNEGALILLQTQIPRFFMNYPLRPIANNDPLPGWPYVYNRLTRFTAYVLAGRGAVGRMTLALAMKGLEPQRKLLEMLSVNVEDSYGTGVTGSCYNAELNHYHPVGDPNVYAAHGIALTPMSPYTNYSGSNPTLYDGPNPGARWICPGQHDEGMPPWPVMRHLRENFAGGNFYPFQGYLPQTFMWPHPNVDPNNIDSEWAKRQGYCRGPDLGWGSTLPILTAVRLRFMGMISPRLSQIGGGEWDWENVGALSPILGPDNTNCYITTDLLYSAIIENWATGVQMPCVNGTTFLGHPGALGQYGNWMGWVMQGEYSPMLFAANNPQAPWERGWFWKEWGKTFPLHVFGLTNTEPHTNGYGPPAPGATCMAGLAQHWLNGLMDLNASQVPADPPLVPGGTWVDPYVPPNDDDDWSPCDGPDCPTFPNPSTGNASNTPGSGPFTEGYDPAPGPSDNDCEVESDDTPLTGSFGADPCTWTRDNLSLSFAQDHRAGWRVIEHIRKWWDDAGLPAMKGMAAQIHAGYVDQTRQIGSALDSQAVTKSKRDLEKIELEARKDVTPTENACVVGSQTSQIASATRMASALSSGLAKSALGGKGSGPASFARPTSRAASLKNRWAAYCTNFRDPLDNAGVQRCGSEKESEPGEPTPAGDLVNADINIEGFLFRDTIDMADTSQAAAVEALMQNLVQPDPFPDLPADVIDTPEGRERILRQEYVESIRSVPANVISGIIARRTSVDTPVKALDMAAAAPSPVTGQEANPAANPTSPEGQAAISGPNPNDPYANNPHRNSGNPKYNCQTPDTGNPVRNNWDAFLYDLRGKESCHNISVRNSVGYMGWWQLGGPALQTIGFVEKTDLIGRHHKVKADSPITPKYSYVGNGQTVWVTPYKWKTQNSGVTNPPPASVTSQQTSPEWQYLNSPAIQRTAIESTMRGWAKKVTKYAENYIGTKVRGVTVTFSGMLGGAHLTGWGGVQCAIKGACRANDGTPIPVNSDGVAIDGNNTKVTCYIERFGGFDTPFQNGPTPVMEYPAQSECGGNSTYSATATNAPVPSATPITPISVDVKATIRGIREKAGVNINAISDAPSYNEVMRAMTMERFFTPEYYTNLQNNISGIKQEITSVRAYQSIVIQDINEMHEKINALRGAIGSIKLNSAVLPSYDEKASIR